MQTRKLPLMVAALVTTATIAGAAASGGAVAGDGAGQEALASVMAVSAAIGSGGVLDDTPWD